MLTIAYLNTVWNVDEFSAMDYTLNIVSKCHFFYIFEHLRVPKRSWKIFHGGPAKSCIFLSAKEWESCPVVSVLQSCERALLSMGTLHITKLPIFSFIAYIKCFQLFMALNGLSGADASLRNCSLTDYLCNKHYFSDHVSRVSDK